MAGIIYSLLNVTFPHFNIMQGLFRKGWAANKVENFMKGMKMGYRRATVQAVRRKVLGLLKFESYYKTLSPDKRPVQARIPELSWLRHEKYKVMFEHEMLDPETGKLTWELGCFYTNEYLTKAEYNKEAVNIIDPDKYKGFVFTGNVVIEQVIHRKGHPW